MTKQGSIVSYYNTAQSEHFLQGDSKFRTGTYSDKHKIYHSQDDFERYQSYFFYAPRHDYL